MALVSFIPVLLFLLLLFLLDSFKLVRLKTLIIAFLSGAIIALLAYFINTYTLSQTDFSFNLYTRYISPVIEETLKAAIIFILIKRKKTGFLIDAGIYGFTIGAGFSVVENIYYLFTAHDLNFLTVSIRGLGTAIMHSGATALVAIFSAGALNREKKLSAGFVPGLMLSIVVHSIFNHFVINPAVQTALIATGMPLLLITLFSHNEHKVSDWLETGFFGEAELLSLITKGEFSKSKAGNYLASLKTQFPAEIIVDMYCFISLYLDLSVKSKRNMLLAECELPIPDEADWSKKLEELKHLRKAIGKSGELALSPLVKIKPRDWWAFEANSNKSKRTKL